MRTGRSRNRRARGMPRFVAGVFTILAIGVAGFFAFSGVNPFSHPYRLTAVFESASNVKPGSPVRIAGVDVGEIESVEPMEGGRGTARVRMRIDEQGLPIRSDAELKIRPRIFLEGNFYVDLKPGTPSSPKLADDDRPIPATQTAAPVQLGDVLASLQSDTRSDLQVFLKEYSKGLEGEGAEGVNLALESGPEAFRGTALTNDAALGLEPTKDIQRVLDGQAKTFAALNSDETALKELVTDFNVTAAAFAREDDALEASIPALQKTLQVGYPALASVNGALPSLRTFAIDALPGVRSTGPTLDVALPFIRQARALVGPDELQATARVLRRQTPSLVALNESLIPLLRQARQLSSCTNNVLVPFANSPIPNPDEAGNDGETPIRQANRGFVGLAGESRRSDANGSWFETSAVPPPLSVRPASPSDGGSQPPARRPDVACETQDPPNLNAPGGSLATFLSDGQSMPAPRGGFVTSKLREAGAAWARYARGPGAARQRSYDSKVEKAGAGK